jgi:uncharacterized protein
MAQRPLPALNVISLGDRAQHKSSTFGAGDDFISPGRGVVHRFDLAGLGAHVLVVEGTRVFALKPAVAAVLDEALARGDEQSLDAFLIRSGLSPPRTAPPVVSAMPLRSLSLAVAQECNLSCSYCYAQGGRFGGEPLQMTREVALASVWRLFESAQSGDRVQLGFLGGEPLLNRPVLRAATEYAVEVGSARGIAVDFVITTNGTLLTDLDLQFFEDHRFAVTISLDGIGPVHDRLRPTRAGGGTFGRILERIGPWLATERRTEVIARVTMTPTNLELTETLEHFSDLGFDQVAFAPMLAAPSGNGQLDGRSLERLLHEMIRCGERFEQAVYEGRRYPFANMSNMLREIHLGVSRTLPCGAGAAYLGVSSDGGLFACHRFVGDEARRMGDLDHGIDVERQPAWLHDRHVGRQEPCRSCWARNLCGGGCHHEVLRRGRVACDFIRGWLDFGLKAYVRIVNRRPDYFKVTR